MGTPTTNRTKALEHLQAARRRLNYAADALGMLTDEDLEPPAADSRVHFRVETFGLVVAEGDLAMLRHFAALAQNPLEVRAPARFIFTCDDATFEVVVRA